MKKRMKQAVSMMLTVVLSLSVLAGCKQGDGGKAQAGQDDSVKLWHAYNTENLMKDVEYPELIAKRDSTLRMHCGRNDVETVQLMITPSTNVSSFDFVVADLKNANGDVLTADNFIHSALSGKLYSHPDEFAEDVRVIDASLLTKDKNPTNFTNVAPFFTKLGYKTTVREADITQEIYQEICYALARGAYVYSQVSADNSADNGHAVAIYGINSNKEVLVLDSGTHVVLTYRIPYQNLTGPSSNIVIVEKEA